MADVSIRGVTYTGVAKLDLDKSGGGSAIYYDTEDADAVAADILTGKKAYGASGLITGTRQPPSGSISITDNGSVDVTDYATALVNVQGGGGGPTASDAILTVTAPAGSTVTATKGSVTLVPTLWTTAADATQECALFVIEQEQFDASTPWTVTATLGTDTATDTVTISSNKQYDLWLSFGHFLYRNGDEFTSRTGGWGWANAGSGTYVNNTSAGQMEVTTTGSGYQTFLHTVNTVSVSEWSSVKCLIQTNKALNLVISTTDGRQATAVVSQSTGVLSDFAEVTLDVSSQIGFYYIGFRSINSSTVYAVKAVWCE